MDVSSDYIRVQQKRYNLFIDQNPETGRFNVVFEIEGKLLYAHQTMLTLDSDTFEAMLSERWNPNKDEPIKIKDYSYDDFYQFLTFLYTVKCQLTDSNIYAMVDIAEFYGVQQFKDYCNEYLRKMEITIKNVFQLMEFAEKYSITQLQSRLYDFVTAKNGLSIINSDEFLETSKDVAKKIIIDLKYKIEPEDVFQAVYKWCEKRADNNPNLNLNDTIKAKIADFLPHIFFRGMEFNFLNEFVVSRGFIFSSFNELSKILCDRGRFFQGKVILTNKNGQTMHGNIIPDKNVLRNIEFLKQKTCFATSIDYCFWFSYLQDLTTSSPLKKRDGIEWYLFYDGVIKVARCSRIRSTDYLIAELTPGSTGFGTIRGCKIEIK